MQIGITNKSGYDLLSNLINMSDSDHPTTETSPDLIYIDMKDGTIYKDLQYLITGHFGPSHRQQFPSLRHLFVPFTGLNGLDLELLDSMDVSVHNTSAHAPFIAERAFAFILSLQSHIISSHNKLTLGDWSRKDGRYDQFWHSLFHKKVAIYGYGHIGKALHQMLKPFHCPVGILSYKGRTYSDTQNFDSLEELAAWCDIFVVTVPLSDETTGIISTNIFHELKGKSLVNIARGPIIDEHALYKSLIQGDLYGFASDVWYNYPDKDVPYVYPSNYPLHKFENVLMTPHDGGAESSSERLRYEDTLHQILEIHSKS